MDALLPAALLGLVVGLILALTGAGGGILAVPALVFGTGIGVAQAAPIGLLAVGMAAALGAVLGLRAGQVRYRAALLIAAVGMLLAPPGLWVGRQVEGPWLGLLFALVLLYVAARTWRQAGAPAPQSIRATSTEADAPVCVRGASSGRINWTRPCARALGMSGALAGFLSGLLGVGGGFVVVPALQRYTDLPMKSAVATSLGVIAIIAASGVASAAAQGAIDWPLATPFAGGTLAGMLVGHSVAARVAGRALQKGFAAVSALVAFGMIARTLYS